MILPKVAEKKWKATWRYIPMNYNTDIGVVENVTQRTVFRNNLNGEKIKLKFSNRYGKVPLTLEKTVVAKAGKEDDEVSEQITVTKNGKEKIVIDPGTEFFSDEIDWSVKAGEDILLFIYIKDCQPVQCAAAMWSTQCCRTLYRTGSGECCMETGEEGWKESREIFPYVEADENKANVVVGVTEICLYTEPDVKSIVLFGDSITHMSYFSDALLKKLMAERPGLAAIENCGIGGNRILRNASYVPEMAGNGVCFGAAGQARFEQDVFAEDIPDLVLILEGINDIMHPYVFSHYDEIVSAADLEKGMSGIIETVHRYNRPIFVGTVMPFWDKQYSSWFEKGEEVRKEFNAWIREASGEDGVIDYDKAAADKANPGKMKKGIHLGDGLHPNTRGGELMAEVAFETIMH